MLAYNILSLTILVICCLMSSSPRTARSSHTLKSCHISMLLKSSAVHLQCSWKHAPAIALLVYELTLLRPGTFASWQCKPICHRQIQILIPPRYLPRSSSHSNWDGQRGLNLSNTRSSLVQRPWKSPWVRLQKGMFQWHTGHEAWSPGWKSCVVWPTTPTSPHYSLPLSLLILSHLTL